MAADDDQGRAMIGYRALIQLATDGQREEALAFVQSVLEEFGFLEEGTVDTTVQVAGDYDHHQEDTDEHT